MKEEVEKLLRLQALDLRLDQLRKDRKALPVRIADAEIDRDRAREARDSLGAEIRKAEREQIAADKELMANDEKIGRCKDRQATAKNDRELKAAEAEEKALEAANDAISERILPVLDRLPEMREEKKRLDAEHDARVNELDRFREEAAREEKEIGALLDETAREREREAALVERSILSRYERIVGQKGLPGIARVERNACEICFRMIPPQRIIEIRKMESWISCEGCGRILTWKE